MAIITTDKNLSEITYAVGESIEIRSGATLTINSTPSKMPGTIQCITRGKLKVVNDSTSTPLVVALLDTNRDFRIIGNSTFEVRGQMLDIGTGNGSSQVWDFTSLYGGVLTDITYVEVEQSPGSGDFMPWHIVEIDPIYMDTRRIANRGSFKADWDSQQPVFFWYTENRTLECGNGINGMAVPYGCRIRIPNILFTIQDWRPDCTLYHGLMSEGAPTGGTFKITVRNGRTNALIGTTADIPYNATAAQVASALVTLAGTGTFTASGGPLPATNISVTASGTYASIPVRFNVDSTALTGGTTPTIYSIESSASNLPLITLTPSGVIDAEACMFSRKFRQNHTAFSSFKAFRVGFGGDGRIIVNSNGTVNLDHTNFTPNPYTIQTGSAVSSVFGPCSLRKTVTSSGYSQSYSQHSVLPQLSMDEDTRHIAYGTTTSTSAICFMHSTLPPIDIVRPRILGSRHYLINLNGNTILNPMGANDHRPNQSSLNAQNQWYLSNCSNIRIVNPTKCGISAVRAYGFATDSSCSNVQIYGGQYDFSNNGVGIASPNGSGLTVQNFKGENFRVGAAILDLPATFSASACYMRKCFSTMSSGDCVFDACTNGVYDLAGCSISGFNEVMSGVENFVGGNFADLGLNPTTGHITFGAFGRGTGMELLGASYTDQAGAIRFESNNDQAIVTIPYIMHGITNFQSVMPTFIGESEGGFSDRWRIINDGGVTGGTFKLSFYDTNNTLLGTTAAISYGASSTTVTSSINAVINPGVTSVTGSITAGFFLTFLNNNIRRVTVDGSLLTGGTKPGTANALGRHNVALANGIALTAGTTPGGLTIEFSLREPAGTWTDWAILNNTNLNSKFASLYGYSPNNGIEVRLRFTAVGDDFYRSISQVSIPTYIDPNSWNLTDATITLAGPDPTDITKVIRISDQAELYSFTGAGVFGLQVGNYYNTECYLKRTKADGTTLMVSLPSTFKIRFGDLGTKNLYYGDQIQFAQSSKLATLDAFIQSRLDVVLSTRASQTTADKAASNAALAAALSA